MLVQTESEILLSAMKFVKMEGHYVMERTSKILKKDESILSWQDLYSKKCTITEEMHTDFVEKNKEPALLNSLSVEIDVKFLSTELFDTLYNLPDKAWSTFFSITRPGISADGQTSIVQVTARCPSGPPNYASILFLEKSIHFWDVKSTHGIYNQ